MADIHCPNCGYKPHPDEGPNCTRCNTPLVSLENEVAESNRGLISPGFVSDSEDRKATGSISLGDDDDLGVQSSATIMEEAAHGRGPAAAHDPSLNRQGYDSKSAATATSIDVGPDIQVPDNKNDRAPADPPQESGYGIKKLSTKELEAIEKELYDSTSYLSETEKLAILKSAPSISPADSKEEFGKGPIIPPTRRTTVDKKQVPSSDSGDATTRIADRVDGIAYFAGHLIQIEGRQQLHEGDILSIRDRHYALQHKRLSNNVRFGIAAALAAILLFWLGAYFTAGSSGSVGSVVGMALDEFDRPLQRQVTINFPELNRKTRTGPDGFFEFENLPVGSHKTEFIFDGEVVGEDFVAVVRGEISTITLRPNLIEDQPAKTKKKSSNTASSRIDKPTPASIPASSAKKSPGTSSGRKRPAKKSGLPKPSTSKLILAANVEGARLALDGNIIGAGNLAYSRLKPGTHSYDISKDGYKSKSGRITLVAGQTKRLNIELTPISQQEKDAFRADEFLASGRSALQDGRRQDAITDLTRAIELDPNVPSSHILRAEAYSEVGQNSSAYSDFIRAAEIYRFKKQYSKAGTAFSRAMNINSRDAIAYIGRGSLFLSRNQEIAAVADFETAVRLDKRNPDAYKGLGDARFAQGYFKKAIKHYKDGRSLAPADPAMHRGLMLAYLRNDEAKKVSKTYQQFVKDVSADQVRRFREDSRNASLLRIIDAQR